MDLVTLLKGLVDQINALQLQLADAESAASAIAKENYDKGFADGVASVPPPVEDDKIYSQTELDAAVEAAVSPFRVELESVKAELESVKLSVDQKISDALAIFKADLKAKYEEMQVAESVIETGFSDLLK